MFGLLFAADGQDAVGNLDLNVVFAQAGKFGGNSDGLVGFVKLDARPASRWKVTNGSKASPVVESWFLFQGIRSRIAMLFSFLTSA